MSNQQEGESIDHLFENHRICTKIAFEKCMNFLLVLCNLCLYSQNICINLFSERICS